MKYPQPSFMFSIMDVVSVISSWPGVLPKLSITQITRKYSLMRTLHQNLAMLASVFRVCSVLHYCVECEKYAAEFRV